MRAERTNRRRGTLVLLASAWVTSIAPVSRAQNGRVASSVATPAAGRVAAETPSPSVTFGSFGARLLSSAVSRRDPDSNTVLSPVSGGLTLSLALFGARGTTATALANVLGFPESDRTTIERDGAALLAALRGRSDVQLEIASAVWVDTSVQLDPTFAASAAAWRATVASLALTSPLAVTTINRWAASATHDRIERILDEPLPDTARLFLANAVYFKGKWLDAFEKSETRPREFVLSSGRRIQVPAMERTGWIGYRRAQNYQVVRLPYRGGRTALYVILPDPEVPVGTLERQMAGKGGLPSLGDGDQRDVHLVLPKLHVEQSTELRPLLSALGAGITLDCRRADFGDMARIPAFPGPRRLCIGKALQKVYLDVNEEGTEAAAVTGLDVLVATAAPPPPLEFIVNRPFLIVLRDDVSGADLFIGSIRRP